MIKIFYEKKERLLRKVRAGTATPEQKDWLRHWGFLEEPKPQPLKPTYSTPTHTNTIYRYRRPMKATPVAKLAGLGGIGEPKKKRRKRKSQKHKTAE